MADDPREFILHVEKKFHQHRALPRPEFLRHFQPRELHFYLKIVAELRARYRPNAPYRGLLRKFPVGHWQEAIFELLARFNRSREPDPVRSGIENGMSLVKAACAEFPELFADNLDDLFVARIDFPGHLTTYMWQQFGQGYREFLKIFVDANEDDTDAQCRGLSYALITGDPEMERWAKDYIRHQLDLPRKLIEGLNITAEMLNQHLLAQGLEWHGNDVRPLYPREVWHVVFPYRYLHGSMDHETFKRGNPLPGNRTFGGSVFATNAAGKRIRIQHFVELDPIPHFLWVTGLQKLRIAADMDQVLLAPGETYQQHRPDGSVVVLGDKRTDYPAGHSHFTQQTPLIKSAKVLFSRQGPAWFFQRLPLHSGSNFYRIGGPPSFIAGPYYPDCVKCGKKMNFLLQLDSNLPREDGQSQEWGQGGMAYVYWCDQCKISAINYSAE
ncbi:MAG: hypothetical protein AAF998_17610 [Bacteroidota bacterium]